ncbi:DUF3239 domain-containing protein [Corynebacterium accolens]|uniref:DUF3239 domain-containing protein n=1 Tax=Corynebacterium TaxID=1716 RepID=UPI0003B84893|nr:MULTISPECIES: DUF3239 domain-containing protein [Corynebacterium]ERS57916.1 hypothetical protein HMPREF1261_01971 [Corynebacterium sp. KPL1818]MDK4209839.1 DUF3239 domain-containing protein [Corynebacterium accolens]MDK4233647.1 DUF3239 domain-containing protein [Corynebacterium accolens]WKS68783.1 DUF3239 domain-containing protein [Corynebacterium accolens]WKS71147.1 DUF3239 domain-containing protein [Corynebacterium accolens]
MKIFKFDVDESFAKSNNELLRDSNRLRVSGLIFGLILVIAGAAVWWRFSWGITLGLGLILFGIVVAIVGVAAASKVGTAQSLYDSYPLAPAVIAEVNERDMVLMALVNTNVDPSLPPRWGACLRTVSAIPGVQRTVGTKVPVAAVSGQRSSSDKEHWQQISPMPIAWGTPDAETVTIARKSIPQDQWQRLERARKRLSDVKATRYDLLVL